MVKDYRLPLFICGLALASLSACGSNVQLSSPERVSLDDVPDWVQDPPGSCAMGVTTFRGNLNLSRKASIARGRDELSRQLQTRVACLLKDYQSQGEASERSFNEELVTQVSRQLSTMNLVGTRARSWHIDDESEPQQLYALVCIEPELFADALRRMGDLSALQRQRLERSANAAFQELDQALEREQQQRAQLRAESRGEHN